MKSKQDDQGWALFLRLCQEPRLHPHLEQVFTLFFTPEERVHLAARSLIIQALLEKKLTQRDIADSFQVSISQITRGSNALKTIHPDVIEKLTEILTKK